MTISVYLSGASSERARVDHYADLIRRHPDMALVSTWHQSSSLGKDALLPTQDQRNVAQVDLGEVYRSQVVFCLAPSRGNSIGAWVELGFAIAHSKRLIVSGPDCADSIFTALAHARYFDDADGYRELVRLACERTAPMTPIGMAAHS